MKIVLYDGVPSPSLSDSVVVTTALEGHRTPRRGSMLVETAIGVALAVVVMIAVAQLVAVVAKQRRETAHTRLATQEVANAMEHMTVLPWGELTAEAAERFVASRQSVSALEDPQLSISVSNVDDSLPTKQIEIALSWRDQSTRRVEPVRLVAWKHQPIAAE
jgi:Tfp pilus assembly protein PilV